MVTAEERLSEHVVVGWRTRLYNIKSDLPLEFVCDVGHFILSQDTDGPSVFRVSVLELLFALLLVGVEFPVASPETGSWVHASQVVFKEARPTVASRMRVLRSALRKLSGAFQWGSHWLGGIDLVDVGVFIPQDGLLIGFDGGLLSRVRDSICDFTSCRPVRASRDLARPFSP